MQKTWVRSLVWEDLTSGKAAKPVHRNYWACALEPESESEVARSCPTLCNSMDCSLPGSSVHGIFQARVLKWVAVKLLSRVRLCDPMDCRLPGFSVHGIFQARILEWVAISFSNRLDRRVKWVNYNMQIPWRRKWQPTPVLMPRKFHGWRSLVGYSPWGHRVGHDWATSLSVHSTLALLLYGMWM